VKMTFLELRRDPGKLLEALEKNEAVSLSRRGREVARVIPANNHPLAESVSAHPAFGMWADQPNPEDPAEIVRRQRRGRFNDL